MQTWQLQEAKNKFSQVVDDALTEGPQVITRRGVEVVVIISYDQYRQSAARRENLSEFFANSPLAEAEFELERDSGPMRDPLAL